MVMRKFSKKMNILLMIQKKVVSGSATITTTTNTSQTSVIRHHGHQDAFRARMPNTSRPPSLHVDG